MREALRVHDEGGRRLRQIGAVILLGGLLMVGIALITGQRGSGVAASGATGTGHQTIKTCSSAWGPISCIAPVGTGTTAKALAQHDSGSGHLALGGIALAGVGGILLALGYARNRRSLSVTAIDSDDLHSEYAVLVAAYKTNAPPPDDIRREPPYL
jgi:hypothetical protein